MNKKFTYLQIDSSRIIHETVDHETLIIDTETGIYYVLRGSGAEIWQLISTGLDQDSLINQLAQQYTTPVGEIERKIQQFLDTLQEAHLLTITVNQAPIATPLAETAITQPRQPVAAFIAPELHVFSDMHHLLLIDPIHEVAETGWPFTPTHTATTETTHHAP